MRSFITSAFSKQNYNNQVKEDEMGGACSNFSRKWEYVKGLVEKPEGKRPLGRIRRRWEENIKIDLREIRQV
jgi:hypothetical protein